ncbi:hypothetical protein COO91_06761 [Nostoc flagelliforme CCNUN1]|uniref:Uncharacterized protein n=1 Tax=Nostoc flagelliforme CCNUN1 TaxID=2038116 RepID=A0A2K8SZ60_9NOSO|nr:hypothetical protein COO91_06761 [Nostoc flagelliforme CCNUN1]
MARKYSKFWLNSSIKPPSSLTLFCGEGIEVNKFIREHPLSADLLF